MIEAGEADRSWCVADNYRSRLMTPDDRVLFWVSAHPQRGVWGAGRVTGPAVRTQGRLRVRVDIPLLSRPLTAATLTAVEALRSMEVLRAPQQSNPSWVSVAEIALIDALLHSAL